MGQPTGVYSLDDLHRYILFLENKEQVAVHTPAQIDDAINMAQMELFTKLKPLYGEDEDAKDALNPFRQIYQVTPNNSPAGLVSLPSGLGPTSPLNYARLLLGMAISYNNAINPKTGFPYGTDYYEIEFVNDDALPRRLRSQLKPVTYSRPIATNVGNGLIQLYPQVPNTCYFTYLAVPVACKWAFTMAGRAPLYDPVNTTQLQWNDTAYNDIVAMACIYLGINLGDGNFVSFMQNLLK